MVIRSTVFRACRIVRRNGTKCRSSSWTNHSISEWQRHPPIPPTRSPSCPRQRRRPPRPWQQHRHPQPRPRPVARPPQTARPPSSPRKRTRKLGENSFPLPFQSTPREPNHARRQSLHRASSNRARECFLKKLSHPPKTFASERACAAGTDYKRSIASLLHLSQEVTG